MDRSLWNTKLKIFDVRFYTINHQELLSVVKVGFKPFQDLSSKTKAIAQSIQEKSVIKGVKCTGHVQQKERNISDHQLHKGYRSVLSVMLSQCCIGVCMT